MITYKIDAVNVNRNLDRILLSIEETAQEGLNYGAEEMLKVARSVGYNPIISGNLKNTSFVFGKRDTGIPTPFISDYWGAKDQSKTTSAFLRAVNMYKSMASSSSSPISYMVYTTPYAERKEREYQYASRAFEEKSGDVVDIVAKLIREVL